MYLFFDENGTLKEIINDKPLRSGSHNVNKIYAYLDNVNLGAGDSANIVYTKVNGIQTQPINAENPLTENSQIPYDRKRDLRFFRYNHDYPFIRFTIPDDVLAIGEDVDNPSIAFSISVTHNGDVIALQRVAVAVERREIVGGGYIGEVAPDKAISVGMWNDLLLRLALANGNVNAIADISSIQASDYDVGAVFIETNTDKIWKVVNGDDEKEFKEFSIVTTLIPATDGTQNIGEQNKRFKNIYLNGFLSNGINNVTIDKLLTLGLVGARTDLSQEFSGLQKFLNGIQVQQNATVNGSMSATGDVTATGDLGGDNVSISGKIKQGSKEFTMPSESGTFARLEDITGGGNTLYTHYIYVIIKNHGSIGNLLNFALNFISSDSEEITDYDGLLNALPLSNYALIPILTTFSAYSNPARNYHCTGKITVGARGLVLYYMNHTSGEIAQELYTEWDDSTGYDITVNDNVVEI